MVSRATTMIRCVQWPISESRRSTEITVVKKAKAAEQPSSSQINVVEGGPRQRRKLREIDDESRTKHGLARAKRAPEDKGGEEKEFSVLALCNRRSYSRKKGRKLQSSSIFEMRAQLTKHFSRCTQPSRIGC